MENFKVTLFSTAHRRHSRSVKEPQKRRNTTHLWIYSNKISLFLDAEQSVFCFKQFVVDTGLDTELSINLSVPLSNVSFQVCAYTGAGLGPWTPIQTLTLVTPGE